MNGVRELLNESRNDSLLSGMTSNIMINKRRTGHNLKVRPMAGSLSMFLNKEILVDANDRDFLQEKKKTLTRFPGAVKILPWSVRRVLRFP